MLNLDSKYSKLSAKLVIRKIPESCALISSSRPTALFHLSLTALVVALRLAVLEEEPVRLGAVEERLGEDGLLLHAGGGGSAVVVPVVVVRPVVHVVNVGSHPIVAMVR